MANHLAIAAATEALRLRVHRAVQGRVAGAEVFAKRPEAADAQGKPRVTIFLYRVSPNAALRNADLPTRDAEGRAGRRPVAALDLHYLLSFTGDEGKYEPQRLLGATAADLHAEPVLSRTVLEQAAEGPDELEGSDLAEQVESVKFAPAPLSIDDLSKLWSVFSQVPYQLSTGYEASVVLIEQDLPVRRAAPVRRPGVDALPVRRPVIERLHGDRPVAGAPALALELTGRNLRGPLTLVAFDDGPGHPVVPESGTRLVVPPEASATLGAGLHGVQVLHEMPLGTPPTPHRAVESDVFPFVLRPAITPTPIRPDPGGPATGIAVGFTPRLQPGQRVRLLLDELLDPPPAGRELLSLTLEPVDDGSAGPWDTRPFDVGEVPAGTYLVRAQVDGAESLAGADESGQPVPRVTLP